MIGLILTKHKIDNNKEIVVGFVDINWVTEMD